MLIFFAAVSRICTHLLDLNKVKGKCCTVILHVAAELHVAT